MPDEWTANRPPTREEALAIAAETLRFPDEPWPPEAVVAKARVARAWAAIAAVAEPARSGADGPVVEVGVCRHHCAATRILPGGNWLHIPSLGACLEPPLTATRVGASCTS